MTRIITMETARRLWDAHHEVEAGEKLVADMEETLRTGIDATPRDTFGRRRGLQLGVPTSESSRTLFTVAPALAVAIIRAHVAEKRAELEALTRQAVIEAGQEPALVRARED